MHQILLKHRPKEGKKEEFELAWENSTYLMEVLANVIKELVPKERISQEDFSKPNHYAQMVWIQAQRDLAQRILDIFPKGVDKHL